MDSVSQGRPADIDPSVKQCKLKFNIKTWSAKWTETLAIEVWDSVSSCFTLLRWEEESCWSAIRSLGRLAVEVSSNSEGLSCTFSPGSKKGRRHKLIYHTHMHTHSCNKALPPQSWSKRPDRHCKTHFNTHVKHILHSILPDLSPVKYPSAWSTLPVVQYSHSTLPVSWWSHGEKQP